MLTAVRRKVPFCAMAFSACCLVAYLQRHHSRSTPYQTPAYVAGWPTQVLPPKRQHSLEQHPVAVSLHVSVQRAVAAELRLDGLAQLGGEAEDHHPLLPRRVGRA